MDIFFKNMLLKIMQIFLAIYLIFFKYDFGREDRQVIINSNSDIMGKLIFVTIAHLMMQPEVEGVLNHLRFIITHPRNFH